MSLHLKLVGVLACMTPKGRRCSRTSLLAVTNLISRLNLFMAVEFLLGPALPFRSKSSSPTLVLNYWMPL